MRERLPPQGLLSLRAFVVRRRSREAWETTVLKLLEICLQFRFLNFWDLWISRIGWDSGKGRGPRASRSYSRPPFGAVVRLLTYPGIPCFASLDPAGALEGLGLRSSSVALAPETVDPALCFVICRLQRRCRGGSTPTGGKPISLRVDLT